MVGHAWNGWCAVHCDLGHLVWVQVGLRASIAALDRLGGFRVPLLVIFAPVDSLLMMMGWVIDNTSVADGRLSVVVIGVLAGLLRLLRILLTIRSAVAVVRIGVLAIGHGAEASSSR